MMSDRKQARLRVLNRQIERLGRRLEDMEDIDRRFSWVRLVVVLSGGVGTFLAYYFGPVWLGRGALIASVGTFALVVYNHRRLDRSIIRFRIMKRIMQAQVARMDLDWKNIPPPMLNPSCDNHPFETDLNLTGERSIHQLIDAASSRGGSQRLHRWLLEPVPDPLRVRERQALVREMKSLSGFRNGLALESALVTSDPHGRWDGEKLLEWLEGHVSDKSLNLIILALFTLSVVNIALFLLNQFSFLPAFWVVSFVIYAGVYIFKYQEYRLLFDEAHYLGETLNKFRSVLVYLEAHHYNERTHLSRLCEPFWHFERQPSKYLKRIKWIASAASMQRNQIVWFFLNAAVPWDFFFAYLLERFKKTLRTTLPVWLDTWYELEALNSLANFAYLNPDGVFPDVITESKLGNEPTFEAQDLGHPLLRDGERMYNDFSLKKNGEVVIVTGSNMSGKSTFLRTLGVNISLAYAGSVVIASSLRLMPLRLFTCIEVSDSLTDGISYFYAEVRRLKALLVELEKEHSFPLFFLIDEIFRGTNNRERKIGSRSYVQALTGGCGVGVISTHDLDLVNLAADIPGIRNCHFREEVKGGRMVFDYRLRPGPSPTTNALKIMQMEGLPVSLEKES